MACQFWIFVGVLTKEMLEIDIHLPPVSMEASEMPSSMGRKLKRISAISLAIREHDRQKNDTVGGRARLLAEALTYYAVTLIRLPVVEEVEDVV